MVNLHLAYTTKINPPNATPLLTIPQVWAGLEHKTRHPEGFVAVIESCKVLEDKDGVVTRDVTFKDEAPGGRRVAREVCTSFKPCWIDFVQEDGATIRNIISDGPDGGLEDLQMTFTFEIRMSNVQEGSPQVEKERERIKGMAKMAVEGSVNSIRKMVQEGTIKA